MYKNIYTLCFYIYLTSVLHTSVGAGGNALTAGLSTTINNTGEILEHVIINGRKYETERERT